MAFRSGWGLQLELAHFASTAIMNLTMGSSGDPHLLSWAMLGIVRQPRNEIIAMKSVVRDIYPPNRTAELTRPQLYLAVYGGTRLAIATDSALGCRKKVVATLSGNTSRSAVSCIAWLDLFIAILTSLVALTRASTFH